MKNIQTATIHIGGMTCAGCETRITKALKNIEGTVSADVRFSAGIAVLTWDSALVSLDALKAAIEQLGYTIKNPDHTIDPAELIGTLIIIASLFLFLKTLGVNAFAANFPLASAGMGYAMLFLIGLLTSLHCVAMCGGITLSQCLPAANLPNRLAFLTPSIRYNVGRIISYTLVGVIVGALGSAFTINGRFQSIVQLAAGVFMVVLGITMLGIFPSLSRFIPRLPKPLAALIDRRKRRTNNPLVIGLLNGLMPCGPLQAMQLYALSTASPLDGGLAMLLFSLGTVPLMFCFGALTTFLSAKFTHAVVRVGAIIVTVMGLTMFSYGVNLAGIPSYTTQNAPAPTAKSPNQTQNAPATAQNASAPTVPPVENGVQVVNSTLRPNKYPAITVAQGVPVKWTINAPAGAINGCNNRMLIREYGVEHRFVVGDNLIEFTPNKTGRFTYSCWMGMIRSSITVVNPNTADKPPESTTTPPVITPTPTNATIPTDHIALAKLEEGVQTIAVTLTPNGITPTVFVVQSGVPARWLLINNANPTAPARLTIPAYAERIDLEQGGNLIQFMPIIDFDFTLGGDTFFGYVKVEDDLADINLESIKSTVKNFKPLRYPDSYFDKPADDA